MPFVKANNLNIFYELHGKGEPLVLIEGFTCNRFLWESFVPILAEHFQVLTFDNRGSGQTETPDGPYSIEMLAKDTLGLMESVGFKEAFVIGHSMGGMILQQMCHEAPHKVKKGMICSSCHQLPEKSLMQIEINPLLMQFGVSQEALWIHAFPWLFSNAFLSKKELVNIALKNMMSNPFPQNPTGYLGQGTALRTFNSETFLSKIMTPLLVVVGDEDILTPLPCSEYLVQKLPQAKLAVIKGEGHLFIAERVEEFIELILSCFKSEVPAGKGL